ncbi:MAG: hypothetical protein AB1765_12385 [Candidatus Hydrogenedentota bacterium]
MKSVYEVKESRVIMSAFALYTIGFLGYWVIGLLSFCALHKV